LVSQWETVRETVEFSWFRVGAAMLLVLGSIMALGQGFASLLAEFGEPRRLRRVFYLSQPAKYVPGGIAQPIGQVVMTAGEGISAARSVVTFVVHSLGSAAAGAFLGSGVSLITDTVGWLRVVSALGLIAPVLMWRPLLMRAAGLVARLTRRDLPEDLIPEQRRIMLAFAWSVVGIFLSAVAFAVLGGATFEDPPWAVVTAFAFAFTVGFLAVPFPSGLAVRETVLALALPGAGLPSIVAISAIHRLVAMAGELLVVTVTTRRIKPMADSTNTAQ
jgi:uncharacterized membrane protein YbhN (UPF0104 family)